ncbi:hypothetical protein KCU67_g5780, partial [Aureobasidium melanogenum]
MQRYGSPDHADHSVHSSAHYSALDPADIDSLSALDNPHDGERQISSSDIPNINTNRSPHGSDVTRSEIHHFDVEEDSNTNKPAIYHKLLPDHNSHSNIDNGGKGGQMMTEIRSVSSQNESPSFVRRIPWAVLLAFLGNLACTALSVYVLVASDGKDEASWSTQPSVYLAILAPLGNILLQYCLSQGLVNDWWNLARRRTTLAALHNRWEHGTSVLSAATSFNTFDKVSAAKILIAATFAVNPLLQRASRSMNRIIETNTTVPFQLATTMSSFRDVGFTSAYTDTYSDPIQLSSAMVTVMRDYTNRAPMINQVGACPGNCTGTVRAAGIVSNCSIEVNNTYYVSNNAPDGSSGIVFEATTNIMNYQTDTQFNLSIYYVETKLRNDTTSEIGELGPAGTVLPEEMQNCDGVLTQKTCALQHAVLEYPIVLRDNVISVDTRASAVKVIQTEEVGEVDNDPTRGEPVFTGFSLAANSITQSTATLKGAGRRGWNYKSTGPLTYFYVQNMHTNYSITCEMTFSDPTDDILTTFNEIMFRISLAAFGDSSNSSLSTNSTMSAQESVLQYESRYAYLIAAIFISMLACCSVLPTLNGFWRLDRQFSLSPIEIAKAFDAPVLRLSRHSTSGLPVEKLVKQVGSTEVQYGTGIDADEGFTELQQRKFVVTSSSMR